MNEQIVKLSEAISKLLSEENKNKSLGELDDELSEYMVEIKELSESGG